MEPPPKETKLCVWLSMGAINCSNHTHKQKEWCSNHLNQRSKTLKVNKQMGLDLTETAKEWLQTFLVFQASDEEKHKKEWRVKVEDRHRHTPATPKLFLHIHTQWNLQTHLKQCFCLFWTSVFFRWQKILWVEFIIA